MKKESIYKVIIAFLFLALVIISVYTFSLQEKQNPVFYYVPPERSFIYSSEEFSEFGFEEYIKEKITTEKEKLINDRRSFIYVNLKEMKLTLYEEGVINESFEVKAKGKVGSFWETPPGVYFVGEKLAIHFSTIAEVWMPYGIQFYGNFFIHGWPFDRAGRALSSGSSGGCVRLQTVDAKVVYQFAERGMPVLIFEEKLIPPLPALVGDKEINPFIDIESESLLVADLDTGEMILTKDIESEIYAGPISLGMMALTGSEMVSLGRRITARDWMISGIGENIIVPGRSYQGHQLISAMISQSSQEAALVFSRFLTPDAFVDAMNIKAQSIGMSGTRFVDVTGRSKENRTTLIDSAKMLRYIHQYRGFIIQNDAVIKGPGEGGTGSYFAIYKMKKADGVNRNIIISFANSSNPKEDLENILLWLDDNIGLKK